MSYSWISRCEHSLRSRGPNIGRLMRLVLSCRPIMNGIDASRNIRRVEGEHPLAEADQRITARLNRGIPIFAVTASLPERERHTIVDAQLDGWLLKPIDFKRLRTLLRGATDQEVRHRELYRPGQWERGGWLADAPEREAPPTPAADVEVAA